MSQKIDLSKIFTKNNFLVQSALLGLIFLIGLQSLYSLKLFVDVYNLSTFKLNIVQGLFLVWNAVNDPLMGYFQDVGCGISWIMDRRKVMMYAGPVWAAVSLIFWFPLSTSNDLLVATHFLVALFSYDTLMTLVGSAYCGICVELGQDHQGRVNIVVLGEIFAIIAGFVIFPIDYLSGNMQHVGIFQVCASVICVIAGLLMFISAYFLDTPENPESKAVDVELDLLAKTGVDEPVDTDDIFKALGITWEIVKQPRFLCLIASNFFRTLRTMASEQFLLMFVPSLLSRNGFMPLGSVELTVFYILVRTLGRVLFLFLFYPVHRHGAHPTLLGLNVLALISGAVILFIGRSAYAAVAVYILVENTLGRCGAQGLYLLICGEVIDTDQALHKRSSPLSTLIFTIKALFNKPAEQLAPIIMMALLDFGGYSRYKVPCGAVVSASTTRIPVVDIGTTPASLLTNNFSDPANSTISTSIITSDPKFCVDLFEAMFQVLVWWPLVCIIGESIFIILDVYFKRKIGPLPSMTPSKNHRRHSVCSMQEVTRPV
ncbi:unnamed protein product, partial [Mesorhabditis spiculigera]